MALNPGPDGASAATSEASGPAVLQRVLEDLQTQGLGLDLTDVLWLPDRAPDGKLAEVQGQCVLVYAEDLEVARELVVHEVVHYEVARAVEPYVLALNAVLGVLGDVAYDRAERLTNRVTTVIDG